MMGGVQSESARLPGLAGVVSNEEIPTDVVLVAADGVKVGAYSLLCAAISPVLKAALTGAFQESTSKEINMDYASADAIKKMFAFAVGSLKEKDITGDEAMDLALVADRLDYKPLHWACERVLLSLLTISTAEDLFACASESGCFELARKARAVIDAGSVSDSTRLLVQEKCELESERRRLAKDHEAAVSDAEKALDVVEKRLQSLERQIDHEAEEVFQEAAGSPSQKVWYATSEDEPSPPYPHTPGRALLVAFPGWDGQTTQLSGIQKLKQKKITADERKKYKSFLPFVYECFDDALEASLPGDAITLAKGKHSCDKDTAVRKSIQIIGMEEGAILEKRDIFGQTFAINIEGVDVCIKNVTIQHQGKAAVVVRRGGKVWLEDCKVQSIPPNRLFSAKEELLGAGVVVTAGTSAYLSGCTVRDTVASAVLVHIRAENVTISDCNIRASSSGASDEVRADRSISQGAAGAVEVCDFHYSEDDGDYADGDPAEIDLTIIRTNIASCFGPAVSYRTRILGESNDQNFSWPGNSSLRMEDNVFQDNGLAREKGSIPDGEVAVLNESLEVFDLGVRFRGG